MIQPLQMVKFTIEVWKIKIYMIYFEKHASELIYARRKINSRCKCLALLH